MNQRQARSGTVSQTVCTRMPAASRRHERARISRAAIASSLEDQHLRDQRRGKTRQIAHRTQPRQPEQRGRGKQRRTPRRRRRGCGADFSANSRAAATSATAPATTDQRPAPALRRQSDSATSQIAETSASSARPSAM